MPDYKDLYQLVDDMSDMIESNNFSKELNDIIQNAIQTIQLAEMYRSRLDILSFDNKINEKSLINDIEKSKSAILKGS